MNGTEWSRKENASKLNSLTWTTCSYSTRIYTLLKPDVYNTFVSIVSIHLSIYLSIQFSSQLLSRIMSVKIIITSVYLTLQFIFEIYLDNRICYLSTFNTLHTLHKTFNIIYIFFNYYHLIKREIEEMNGMTIINNLSDSIKLNL